MDFPSVPFLARLVAFETRFGTARLVAEDGASVSAGASSFRRHRNDPTWLPTVGTSYRVAAGRPIPRIGFRATDILELEEPLVARRPDVPPPMPTHSLSAAFDWLRAQGEALKIAGEGASEQAIELARRELGVPFPESYTAFLREHHWFESRLLSTFPLRGDLGIVSQRAAVRRRIAEFLALPGASAELQQNCLALSSWAPIATVGNPIPHGSALFIDTSGAFRWVNLKELHELGGVLTAPFERVLIESLRTYLE